MQRKPYICIFGLKCSACAGCRLQAASIPQAKTCSSQSLGCADLFLLCCAAFVGAAGPAEPATPGTPGITKQPGFAESMRSFLLKDLLSDPELAAEIDAGKGAAHFNLQQYQAS